MPATVIVSSESAARASLTACSSLQFCACSRSRTVRVPCNNLSKGEDP